MAYDNPVLGCKRGRCNSTTHSTGLLKVKRLWTKLVCFDGHVLTAFKALTFAPAETNSLTTSLFP